MAQTVYCNGHPDVAAVMLIQELGTPDVMTLCAACVIAWAGAVVASTEQPPPGPIGDNEPDPVATEPAFGSDRTVTLPGTMGGDDGWAPDPSDGDDDTATGGDDNDGTVRARDRGTDGVPGPALGEAGPADGGTGGGTDQPGRQGRKPAEARTGD